MEVLEIFDMMLLCCSKIFDFNLTFNQVQRIDKTTDTPQEEEKKKTC